MKEEKAPARLGREAGGGNLPLAARGFSSFPEKKHTGCRSQKNVRLNRHHSIYRNPRHGFGQAMKISPPLWRKSQPG
jgi:hypothetical protein